MKQAWRWFGSQDPVSLDYIRQAGATDIVSALHEVPVGEAWTNSAIVKHQAVINKCQPLTWSVVESIPVHDAIKRSDKNAAKYIATYIDSLKALAAANITTVCYNFMPLLDWTRTDLSWLLPTGGRALRFDAIAFAAFDLFILKRPNAEADYSNQCIIAAETLFKQWQPRDIDKIDNNILAGLPGGTTEAHSLKSFQMQLDRYNGIGAAELFANLVTFLREIIPVAEDLGIAMAIHPDDPPRSLLGLPRIVSTRDDLATIFSAVPSVANGLTFCTGSLGVRADNDLVAMFKEFAARIHFVHFRGTRREENTDSFYEAEHLDSDVNMLGVVEQFLIEQNRRESKGLKNSQIAFRPDHGHQILDDLDKTTANPGYTAIGRLKGLAELRGVMAALEYKR